MLALCSKPFLNAVFLPLIAVFGAAIISARPVVAQPRMPPMPLVVKGTPIDVTALVASGQAKVSGVSGDIGTSASVFCNQLFRSAQVNPATITLAFAHDIEVSGFRVLFSHAEGNPAHQWQIEAATAEDIEQGRYRIIQPWVDVPQDEPSARQLRHPMMVRWLRLRVQRLTGDDFVHIESWQLLAPNQQVAQKPIIAEPTLPIAPVITESKRASGGDTESVAKPETPSPSPEAKTELQTGEIALRGTVTAIDTEASRLTLGVTAFRLPSGRESKLSAPKSKTIIITPQTAWIGGALNTLKIGTPLEVIGPDAGSGKALFGRAVICF